MGSEVYRMSPPTSFRKVVTKSASVELVATQDERSHITIQNLDTGNSATNGVVHISLGQDATQNDPELLPGGYFELGDSNWSYLKVTAIGDTNNAVDVELLVSVNMAGFHNPAQSLALRAGDVEIGAVEIKDHLSDIRATVNNSGALMVTSSDSQNELLTELKKIRAYLAFILGQEIELGDTDIK